MGRRLYKMGRDTHAKGETFEIEKKDRYYINVSLLSLKTLEDYDIGRGGEFYFKVNRSHKTRRVPDRGEIILMENQIFTARQDFTLWTEFIELEQGDSKELELEVALFEQDIHWDKKVFEVDVPITLGRQTQYVVLEDAAENTKAKVKISATRTRF
ncbi:MAG: hypothetical protein HWN66_01070 [Candidatus Helarchaeota archaeon]|nr:hypothetical protein [Candidatus Helarchaeota archaeon]